MTDRFKEAKDRLMSMYFNPNMNIVDYEARSYIIKLATEAEQLRKQNEIMRQERDDALIAKAELLDALNGVMYWDNEKPEWDEARIIRDKYKPSEEDN